MVIAFASFFADALGAKTVERVPDYPLTSTSYW